MSTHGQFNNSVPSQIPRKKYLERHILRQLDFHFTVIAREEARIYNDIIEFKSNIPNNNFEFALTPLSAGGVGVYVDEAINDTLIERTSNEAFQALLIASVGPQL